MLTICLACQLRPQQDPAFAACAAAGPTAVHQLVSLQLAAAAAVAQNKPRLRQQAAVHLSQVQLAVALKPEHHLAAQAYKAEWVALLGPTQELALVLLCNMCIHFSALSRRDDPVQTTGYSVLKALQREQAVLT